MHLYCGSPDVEDVLVAELKRHQSSKGIQPAGPGLVRAPGDVVDAVFARQVLPRAQRVTAKTPADLAAALLDVDDGVSLDPARIDVDAPELAREGSAARQKHPLAHDAARLLDTLRKKTAGRREKGKLGPPTAHRLRAVLTGPYEAWRSISVDDTDDPLLAWPALFPFGRATEEQDRDAPSSAHRKLNEAFAWLDRKPQPDDVVVDLGAAPGGWTRVLRDRKARVIAVDRADMDAGLLKDPHVTHLRASALDVDLQQHRPAWVVCDVIWEPQHAVTIANRCLAIPTLQAAVITLKLKQPIAWGVLDDAVQLTQRSGFSGRVKHLRANKLEVTLLLRRD